MRAGQGNIRRPPVRAITTMSICRLRAGRRRKFTWKMGAVIRKILSLGGCNRHGITYFREIYFFYREVKHRKFYSRYSRPSGIDFMVAVSRFQPTVVQLVRSDRLSGYLFKGRIGALLTELLSYRTQPFEQIVRDCDIGWLCIQSLCATIH